MTMHSQNPPRVQRPGCQDAYRPPRQQWLLIGAVTFLLVYWVLSVVAQEITLTQPVAWWDFVRARVPLPLPEVNNPILRIAMNIISPQVLFHLLIPGLIGYNLAQYTATNFLQAFYGLPTFQQAYGFLIRLRLARRTTVLYRPSSLPRMLLPAGLGALFFLMLILFVLVIDYTGPGEVAQGQVYYYLVIALLIGFWLILIGYSLMLTRDYLNRQQGGQGRIARLAAQRLPLYLIVVMLLVGVPLFWMFILYLPLRNGLVSPGGTINFLLVIAAVLTLTYVIVLRVLPGHHMPVLVSGENLETLRRGEAVIRIGGPGNIVLTNSNDVAVTESNGRFCRVLKAGRQTLAPYEYIYNILDMRQHEQEGTGRYTTRDGIQVEIEVGLTFRIASNDEVAESPAMMSTVAMGNGPVTRATATELFPYGQQAVHRAAYKKTVLDKDGNGVREWHALPLRMAQSQLRKAIAEVRYDDLFAPGEREAQPHPLLRDRIWRFTQDALNRSNTGVHLLHVRLGAIKPAEPAVQKEHIRSWRAFWEKIDEMLDARGSAEAMTEVAQARREAERLMMETIVKALLSAEEQYGYNVTRQIPGMRLVETLDRMARRSPRFGARAADVLLQQLEELQADIDQGES